MRRARAIVLSGLLTAGCASLPDGGLPSGTYREVAGSGDAIVIDGEELTVYLPALHAGRRVFPDGRAFRYDVHADGFLMLYGSSNDTYYLDLTRFCAWRWSAPAIECHREGGAVTRFTRDTSGAVAPPAMPQQQVWLAAARQVLTNGNPNLAGASRALPVYHRTSFVGRRSSLAQLERQAAKGFCGLSREEAGGVVRSLHWQNKRTRSIGDVFDHRPEFAVVDRRPDSGDYLGLSDVMFSREGDTAYLNVDISGLSGSIVQMKRDGDSWAWAAECAVWTSY